MECKKCNCTCIKKGFQKTGKQKYYCKTCKCYQQESYRNKACEYVIDKWIVKLTCNSYGIRDISRILSISVNTVLSRIKQLASTICKPNIFMLNKTYEVDELKTYIGNRDNECWVCAALEKSNKQLQTLEVGRRTKRTLKKVLQPLVDANAKRIYTDKYPHYPSLIPEKMHSRKHRGINTIERQFLKLRTHIKRLARKTICYSKQSSMLESVLKLYVWQDKISLIIYTKNYLQNSINENLTVPILINLSIRNPKSKLLYIFAL